MLTIFELISIVSILGLHKDFTKWLATLRERDVSVQCVPNV